MTYRVAMTTTMIAGFGALAAGAGCTPGHADRGAKAGHAPAGVLAPTKATDLCATRGELPRAGAAVHISDPTVRMVAPDSHGDAAALRFTYRGASEADAALASGQLRRQLGLKLRAEDGCNVVYVMWRIHPTPGLEVSVKRNPGDHTDDECGTRGYTKVKPRRATRLPALTSGASHTLEARITGDRLVARVDDAVVWDGKLPAGARRLGGPAGLRTDNVTVDAELLTAAGPTRRRTSIPGCAK